MVDRTENRRIQRVIDFFDTNKIIVPKKFYSLLESPDYASELCKELGRKAGDVMEKLMDYVFADVGINSDTKGLAVEIAKVWATLIDDKAKVKVGKIENEIDSYNNIIPIRRLEMDIREETLRYVGETIEGIKIIAQDENSHIDRSIFESALSKLETLYDTVSSVIDIRSKNANDLAYKIVGSPKEGGLLAWRESAKNKLITKTNERFLDMAIQDASSWAAIVKYPEKRDRFKEEDGAVFIEDEFSVILKVKPLEETANQFFALLTQKKKDSEEVEKLSEEVKSLKTRLAKIDDEIEEWDKKVDNGICSLVEADDEIQKLEDEKSDISRTIKTRSMILSSIKGQFRFAKRIMDNYEILNTFYQFFRTQSPYYFYDIFSHINFNDFLQILNSSPSSEAIDTIDNMLFAAKKTVLDRSEVLRDIVDGLDELLLEEEEKGTIKEDPIKNPTTEAEKRRQERQAEREAKRNTGGTREPVREENTALKDIVSLTSNDN
ncbi:MAG: hypothetical protein PHG90_03770 [Clostridia bacterium]|jgi:hypothetical protein|nr:hypothetical protein [Clostridia bacterium]